MKSRLCRSSRKAFAFAHPLMLSATFPREVLFACPLSSPWNLPFFTGGKGGIKGGIHPFLPMLPLQSTLSRQGAAFTHLDSHPPHDLVISTNGSVPFPFDKGDSGVLANCSLCSIEATLFFSAGPVCSSFSTEAYVILQALRWSLQHQHVCKFSSLL